MDSVSANKNTIFSAQHSNFTDFGQYGRKSHIVNLHDKTTILDLRTLGFAPGKGKNEYQA